MKAFIVILSVFAVQISAKCEDWPRYFDNNQTGPKNRNEYTFVKLQQDGKSQVLLRRVKSDGTVWIFHDDAATWRETPPPQKDPRRFIQVQTSQFRFSFYLEEDRLTHLTEMGEQEVLLRRHNAASDLE
ncbi:MAG TPA: hypothetical protein VD994_02895 [Prosthecobacter sp.]|nr:hypothetical protein [Prosthecobacter sp.]